MAWCPSCSFEYPPGKKKCPECDFMLPGNGGEVKIRNKCWTVIRETSDAAQADIIKDLLKANGYDVFARDGKAGAKLTKSSGKSSQHLHQVLVPTEHAKAAAGLLRADSVWEPEEEGDDSRDRSLFDFEEEDDFMSDDDYFEHADSLPSAFEDEEEVY
jgi:hypothetical protein